jgi:DNA repair protein RadC
MPITDWPAAERPREKLLARGAASLTDAELLAIFLRTGTPGRTAVDLARELLGRFGGLRALLRAGRADCAVPGFGEAKYAQLQAALEIARRHLAEALARREALKDPAAVRRLLQARLRDREHETFAALFLDNQHRVIAFDELSQGTIDGASVYPREVIKAALKHGAAAVIFAHNHPSGAAQPSQADELLTRSLKEALALVDIKVLDHFIVAGNQAISFAERGLV